VEIVHGKYECIPCFCPDASNIASYSRSCPVVINIEKEARTRD